MTAALYPTYPAALARAVFIRLRCTLELGEPCRLGMSELLGLRCRLLAAAAALPAGAAGTLLVQAPDDDPLTARLCQKPSPPLTIALDAAALGEHEVGDSLHLEATLFGRGTLQLPELLALLRRLAVDGVVPGGRAELEKVECLGPDGSWQSLWHARQPHSLQPPILLRADQWLDAHWPAEPPLVLEFLTPTRLISAGRALRRPRFTQFFPFMLRRVTSLLRSHCEVEEPANPAPLLAAAREVCSQWQSAQWDDWRATPTQSSVGGLTGRLRLDGPGLDELCWVILLATLTGLGKGAAYGAGRCRLVPCTGSGGEDP